MPILDREAQSAFVQKRQILDRALIVNEVVWWMKKGRVEGTLLKLDFHKAYDSVKWKFVDDVLELMEFGAIWTKWNNLCLSSALTSIVINGSPTTPFKMERGLRQGDFLFPFLFVLAAEVLNCLMLRAKDIRIIDGVEKFLTILSMSSTN